MTNTTILIQAIDLIVDSLKKARQQGNSHVVLLETVGRIGAICRFAKDIVACNEMITDRPQIGQHSGEKGPPGVPGNINQMSQDEVLRLLRRWYEELAIMFSYPKQTPNKP